MAPSFIFTHAAEKKFLQMEESAQERIRSKIQDLKQHGQIMSLLKPLRHFDPATHRLRIGPYRLILQRCSEDEFLVLDIGHRSDIYR